MSDSGTAVEVNPVYFNPTSKAVQLEQDGVIYKTVCFLTLHSTCVNFMLTIIILQSLDFIELYSSYVWNQVIMLSI